MDDAPHQGDPEFELELRARARTWARGVRRTAWAVVFALVALGAGAMALLR